MNDIDKLKELIEAAFYSNMLELYLKDNEYENLTTVNRIKVANVVKKSLALNIRNEC